MGNPKFESNNKVLPNAKCIKVKIKIKIKIVSYMLVCYNFICKVNSS